MKRITQLSLVLVVLLLGTAIAGAAPQLVGDVTTGVGERLGWEFTFRTNGPGMSHVEWGEDATYGNSTNEYVSLDTHHRHVINGLLPDTTYHYRIVLSDWSGNSTEIEDTTFTTPALEAPTNVGAYGVESRALLGWSGVFGAAEYRIYRADQSGGPYEQVGSTSDTNYIDEGLVDGQDYFYVISAVSAAGEEIKSDEVDATPHPLAGNVIGAWLMSECEGTTVRDFSMHGNHGNFINADWAEGRFNCAANIKPSQNYIHVPTMNGFDELDTEMTITVWFYLDDLPDTAQQYPNRRVIQSGVTGGQFGIDDSHFRLLFEFGEFKFQAHPQEVIARDQEEAIVPGQWQHIAAVYSGDALRIYLNGNLYAEDSAGGRKIGSNVGSGNVALYIGTKSPTAPMGDWWDGLLDEVAVFNKALTQQEVELVMHGLSALF